MMTLKLMQLGFPYDVVAQIPAEDAREYLVCASALQRVRRERQEEEAWFSQVAGGM